MPGKSHTSAYVKRRRSPGIAGGLPEINYVSGGYSYQRLIKKPVAGTVNIYLNSILQSAGYTVDTTTGLVTFASAPASGVLINADFQFDVPVRFDTDTLAARADSPGVFIWESINIVELRI